MEELVSINPLNNQLILNHVLEQLGNEDVLNCRLVNHFWNSNAVHVLKKRDCAITVDSTNIYQVRNLWEQSNQPGRELISLGWSLTIKNLIIGSMATKYLKTADEMLQFNPNLVSLHYDTKLLSGPTYAQTIWAFLSLASSTLRNLHLNVKFYNFNDPNEKMKSLGAGSSSEGESSSNIVFPQLKSFYYEKHRGQEYPVNLVNIIESSPQLYSFSLHETFDQRFRYQGNGSGIGRLFAAQTFQSYLIELEISVHGPTVLDELCQFRFNQLKSLTVHHSIVYIVCRKFCHFLRHNCPTLTALDLNFQTQRHEASGYDDTHYRNILQVPKLVHFGFHIEVKGVPSAAHSWRNKSFTLPDNLTVATQAFNSLKSIHVDFGACTSLAVLYFLTPSTAVMRPAFKNVPVFPTVSTLTINIPVVDKLCPLVLPRIRDLIGAMLPKLSHVKVNVETQKLHTPEYMICALLKLDGITSLEISNYYHDWLAEIFHECPNVPFLENLDTLKLLINKKANLATPRPPKLHMGIIRSKLPYLRLLQITKKLLKNDGNLTDQELDDKLNAIQLSFPILKIVLL